MRKTSGQEFTLLCESLLKMQTLEECRAFLEDLCTVTERKAMEQRLEVAMYLRDGMIYQDILGNTGASSTTISRVNRCLQYGSGGYQAILPRLDEVWQKEKEKNTP